ncbi:ABC transporter ATP-binding protein [Acuticoccus mangrovi]|uniref:ABC transporter ATP-binding protein n=1 Tax=Acuticoccus mangrovi TaxID=2796142 RepID=A0A934ISP0_9HYPH|nr:ABC transporter ATP-binding protein [Acuticoccus mangrovi]MBJ3778071.1 ABC transporter ATP-binding protein [Acuticoccus mangrovi]
MLNVENLRISYGRAEAVRNVDLTVSEGEAVAIVGPNGAGKSSTMLAIAGAIRSTGRITLGGRDLGGLPPESVCRLGLAMVPEGRGIFPQLSVEENLMLGTSIRRDREQVGKDRADVFHRFPILEERRRSDAGKLSGGEQQQLAIARALMMRPKLLLVDEPSLGLAPMMVATVYKFLEELRSDGMTMLIVEQSVTRALAFSNRLYLLREGRVQLSGSSETLSADRQALEEAYFGFEHKREASVPS